MLSNFVMQRRILPSGRGLPGARTRATVLACCGLIVMGCGATDSLGAKDGRAAIGVERRDVELKHEACDLGSKNIQVLDANVDGRPEIVTVFDGGHAYCRAADINLDGTIDVFTYFDPSGAIRRRESGFDRDALPDEISYYVNGQIVRKERETNNDGKLDTWDFYEGGRLIREERDSAGDGFINQWWTFPDPQRAECAIVVSDNNSDTKPDPDSQIDLCAADDARPVRPTATKPAPGKPAAPVSPPPATGAPPAAPAVPPASSPATPQPKGDHG